MNKLIPSTKPFTIAPPAEAYVIAVANHKGGVGRTTISMNLAAALHRRGYKVLVVDADQQGSAMLWANSVRIGFSFSVISLSRSENIQQDIARHAKNYHFIIVDCPPVPPQSEKVMPVCDLVLVPCLPSRINIAAATEFKKSIDQAQIGRPTLLARLLLNRCEENTPIAPEVFADVKDIEIPLLSHRITDRQDYVEFWTSAAATAEFDAVTDEILQALEGCSEIGRAAMA